MIPISNAIAGRFDFLLLTATTNGSLSQRMMYRLPLMSAGCTRTKYSSQTTRANPSSSMMCSSLISVGLNAQAW